MVGCSVQGQHHGLGQAHVDTVLTQSVKNWILSGSHENVLNVAVLNLWSESDVTVIMQHVLQELGVSVCLRIISGQPCLYSIAPSLPFLQVYPASAVVFHRNRDENSRFQMERWGGGCSQEKSIHIFFSTCRHVLKSIWGQSGPNLLRLSYCWLHGAFIPLSLQLLSMSPKRL